MRDLELAKEILKKKDLSLVIVKQGEPLYESSSSGISGLLRAIEKLRGVPVEHEGLVPKILDREGKNICPFEQFSLTINSIDEAYEQLKAFTENLRRKQ